MATQKDDGADLGAVRGAIAAIGAGFIALLIRIFGRKVRSDDVRDPAHALAA